MKAVLGVNMFVQLVRVGSAGGSAIVGIFVVTLCSAVLGCAAAVKCMVSISVKG